MKKLLLLSILFFSFTHPYPRYIPFNPLLHPDGSPVTNPYPIQLPSDAPKGDIIVGVIEQNGQWTPALQIAPNHYYVIQSHGVSPLSPSQWSQASTVITAALSKPYTLVPFKNADPLLEQWNTEDIAQHKIFRAWLFYNVMGVTETYFKAVTADGTDLTLFPLPGDTHYQKLLTHFPGRKALTPKNAFTVVSLKDLRAQAMEKLQKSASAAPGTFTILNSYDLIDKDLQAALKLTDIRAQMADPKNNDAVFQLASNFDCLEGGMGALGAALQHMMHAPVQGEEASLASIGGTIVRKYYHHNYAILHDHKKIPDNNLLKELQAAGKLTLQSTNTPPIFDTARIHTITQKSGLSDADMDMVYIGWHEQVPVTSGYYWPVYNNPHAQLPDGTPIKAIPDLAMAPADRLQFLINNHLINPSRTPLNIFNSFPVNGDLAYNQIVNQVVTAAYNIASKAYKAGPQKGSYPLVIENSAKVLLKASYWGTLYKAYIEDKKKVYLTLMGAGAFGNKLSWIGEILSDSTLIDFIHKSGLEVYLNIFTDPRIKAGFKDRDQRKKPDYQQFMKTMHSVAQKLPGTPVAPMVTSFPAEPTDAFLPTTLVALAESLQQLQIMVPVAHHYTLQSGKTIAIDALPYLQPFAAGTKDNAGIIPYYTDTTHKRVLILLHDDGKLGWNDFGGLRSSDETLLFDTAYKKFRQKVGAITDIDPSAISADSPLQRIKSNRYIAPVHYVALPAVTMAWVNAKDLLVKVKNPHVTLTGFNGKITVTIPTINKWFANNLADAGTAQKINALIQHAEK